MKIKIILMALLVSCSAVQASTPAVEITTTQADQARAERLINRLHEIKKLAEDEPTAEEKAEHRKEVRSIKSMLKQIGGGIYISVGAVILILILLIILL